MGAVTWQAARALYAYDPVLTLVLAALVVAGVVTFVVLRLRAHRSRRDASVVS